MEILVIGGIAAGMSVAAKAARTNKEAKVTVVEMEDYISLGACGLPYYLGQVIKEEKALYARTPQQMRDAGINILLKHQAIKVDFDNKEATLLDLTTNKQFNKSYDKLMIATGASAIIPPIEGIEADNVYTITKPYTVNKLINNLDQYKDIVIIGGGFIGVEVAEQLAQLNKNIKLIQADPTIMFGPFDPEFSAKIQSALEELDIKVYTDEAVKQLINENNHVTAVKTDSDTYKADAVIVAVGFRPNTNFIKGQLDMLQNGAIIIDEYGQTSIEDVFAAGDCATINHRFSKTQYIPLATYANKMGRIIGNNIVTDKKEWQAFMGALGTSAIKVGHYEAVVTGLTEKEAKKLGLNINTTLIETNNHASYYPNVEKIMIKLVYDKETYVLYGAQMFGKDDVVLRATGLTTAIHAGLTTKELGFIDYAYSPPFASTWEAINIAANTAK